MAETTDFKLVTTAANSSVYKDSVTFNDVVEAYMGKGDYAIAQACLEVAWDYDPKACAILLPTIMAYNAENNKRIVKNVFMLYIRLFLLMGISLIGM